MFIELQQYFLCRTVRTISTLIQHRRHSLKAGVLSEGDTTKFQKSMIQELLTLIQQMSDFGIAINGLGPGFLWGGKLRPRHIGLLGMTSTFITLCKILRLVP